MLPSLVSSFKGMAWPGLTKGNESDVLGLLWQLERSQWLRADDIRRGQQLQLASVMDHACRYVPAYRERFAARGLLGNDLLQCWSDIPILTRRDLQQGGLAYQSTSIPPGHGPTFENWSGGSTGVPIMVLGTRLTALHWRALTLREHLWHERAFEGNLAVIRFVSGAEAGPPQGAVFDNWGIATAGLFKTGASHLLSITSTTQEQLAWLTRVDPKYLLTYPSVLRALLQLAERTKTKLDNLRELRTFGEVLDAETRHLAHDVWNVPIVDMYSSQEVGYLALQCPESGDYHIQSEHLLVEVVHADGSPCQPGEIGRILVTTLTNYAMPLLRYEIGDFAEVGGVCRCGRGLPVLKRVLGRQRNMFRLPDGSLRWPAVQIEPGSLKGGEFPIHQFQVVQKELETLDVNLVASRPLQPTEEQLFRMKVEEWLGFPFELRFRYVEEIPRSPTGKFEDFRCDL